MRTNYEVIRSMKLYTILTIFCMFLLILGFIFLLHYLMKDHKESPIVEKPKPLKEKSKTSESPIPSDASVKKKNPFQSQSPLPKGDMDTLKDNLDNNSSQQMMQDKIIQTNKDDLTPKISRVSIIKYKSFENSNSNEKTSDSCALDKYLDCNVTCSKCGSCFSHNKCCSNSTNQRPNSTCMNESETIKEFFSGDKNHKITETIPSKNLELSEKNPNKLEQENVTKPNQNNKIDFTNLTSTQDSGFSATPQIFTDLLVENSSDGQLNEVPSQGSFTIKQSKKRIIKRLLNNSLELKNILEEALEAEWNGSKDSQVDLSNPTLKNIPKISNSTFIEGVEENNFPDEWGCSDIQNEQTGGFLILSDGFKKNEDDEIFSENIIDDDKSVLKLSSTIDNEDDSNGLIEISRLNQDSEKSSSFEDVFKEPEAGMKISIVDDNLNKSDLQDKEILSGKKPDYNVKKTEESTVSYPIDVDTIKNPKSNALNSYSLLESEKDEQDKLSLTSTENPLDPTSLSHSNNNVLIEKCNLMKDQDKVSHSTSNILKSEDFENKQEEKNNKNDEVNSKVINENSKRIEEDSLDSTVKEKPAISNEKSLANAGEGQLPTEAEVEKPIEFKESVVEEDVKSQKLDPTDIETLGKSKQNINDEKSEVMLSTKNDTALLIDSNNDLTKENDEVMSINQNKVETSKNLEAQDALNNSSTNSKADQLIESNLKPDFLVSKENQLEESLEKPEIKDDEYTKEKKIQQFTEPLIEITKESEDNLTAKNSSVRQKQEITESKHFDKNNSQNNTTLINENADKPTPNDVGVNDSAKSHNLDVTIIGSNPISSHSENRIQDNTFENKKGDRLVSTSRDNEEFEDDDQFVIVNPKEDEDTLIENKKAISSSDGHMKNLEYKQLNTGNDSKQLHSLQDPKHFNSENQSNNSNRSLPKITLQDVSENHVESSCVDETSDYVHGNSSPSSRLSLNTEKESLNSDADHLEIELNSSSSSISNIPKQPKKNLEKDSKIPTRKRHKKKSRKI